MNHAVINLIQPTEGMRMVLVRLIGHRKPYIDIREIGFH